MKHAMKKAIALLLTLCALFSVAVPGIATEPVVTVESEPIVEAEAPAEPATLTLAVNGTLLKEINALSKPQGQLGSVRIVEELSNASDASWSLSRTKGEALTLSLTPSTGREVTLAYAADSAFGASSEQVSYTLTCSVGGLSQTMKIDVTVVRKPTAILPAQASVTAKAGEAFTIGAPKPQPEGAVFPEGTAFLVRIDGAENQLAGLTIAKEGVYAATVVAAFGGVKLEAPITITVEAAQQAATETEAPQATPAGAGSGEGAATPSPAPEVTEPPADGTEPPSGDEANEAGGTPEPSEPPIEEPDAEVTKIVITPQKSELTEGESTLVFGMVFSDGEVDKEEEKLEWTSSDPDILSVDRIEDGGSEERARVTAGEPGEVTLTATAPNGVEARMMMTVAAAPAPYALFEITSTDSRFNGGAAQIDLATNAYLALSTVGGSSPVTWSSNNTSYVTVDSTGLVTGKKATGSVVVTITAKSGTGASTETATCTVKVGYKMPSTPMALICTTEANKHELYTGESMTLTLSPLPHANVKTVVSWTNKTYATVTTSGRNWIVKGAGSNFQGSQLVTVTVTVTDDFGGTVAYDYDIYITARITSVVIHNDATSKAITTAALNTTNNTDILLKAVTVPADKTDKIAWASSSEAIASISGYSGQYCTVTANSAGTATITATATDGSNKVASVRVTVTAGVEVITIIPPTTGFPNDLMAGTSMRLTATVLPSTTPNKTVTWQFTDVTGTARLGTSTTYATVSSGTVTAKAGITAPETVHVMAISQADTSVVSNVHTITLHPALSTFAIVATVNGVVQKTPAIGLEVGDPVPVLDLNILPNDDVIFSGPFWSSSNPTIVSVDAWGNLTPHKAGTVTITAEITTWNNVRRTATVSVTCKSFVQGLEIVAPDPLFVTAGKTVSLGAKLTPSTATNRTVTWSSSDTTVAKVSTAGVVTGGNVATVKTATITAKSADERGEPDSVVITVYPATTAVEIFREDDPTQKTITTASIDLYQGNSNRLELGFRIKPIGALEGFDQDWKRVTWTTSNAKVAIVNEYGVVTGLSQGSAVITATAADGTGKKASVTVTVAHLVGSIVITGPTEVAVGKNIQLTANILPELATNKGITWTSNNTARATVTTAGSVRGVSSTASSGPVTITATAKDGSGATATYDIEVFPSATSIMIYVDGGAQPKSEAAIDLGNSSPKIQLSCDVLPYGASQKVTYTSSAPDIVSVDKETGEATGIKAGTATITATAADGSNIRQTIKVTVSVTITEMKGIVKIPQPSGAPDYTSVVEIGSGKTVQLDAIFLPTNATYKTFTWTSSNTNVATVSASGLVTARTVTYAQYVDITATAKDGSGMSATRQVRVLPAATSVSIKELGGTAFTSKSIDVSETSMQLDVNVLPASASQTVSWKSSNTVVATVDQDGLVTFTGRTGDVIITATAQDGSGKSASVTIKVLQFVTGNNDYEIDGPVALGAGKSAQYRIVRIVTNGDKYDNKVATKWSIDSNPPYSSYATIDQTGKVTISSALTFAGSITIRAEALDGSSGIFDTFEIDIAPSIASIEIRRDGEPQSISTMGIAVGVSADVNVYALPANANTNVTWTTSNATIATVTQTGTGSATILGVKKGQAVITATAQDGSGKRATLTVNVDAETESLEIKEGAALSLVKGKTKQLTLVATPSNAVTRDVKWSSDDESIAKVSASGLVTAVGGPGSALITAAARDNSGLEVRILVTVYEKAVESMFVSLNNGLSKSTETWVTAAGAGQPMPGRQLSAAVSPAGACPDVSWSSANKAIATVSNTGYVEGVKNGKVIITATALDGSGKTATITVTVQTVIQDIYLENSAPSITLNRGNSKTLKVTFNPAKPTNTTLTWSSNRTDIVTVNATGTVVVKSNAPSGTATITAMATDGSGVSETINIIVP